ncbi:tail fiber assembly protein [Citrobacter braakii]|uniref:Tail fiber assembly protein n=1 Tax=Citrobacter braakii TaxID=57706 RepID=A0ABR6TXV8_CITBR|nr:tail fiber assembly protein [Citrobacter braakii]MBC2611715.1 tail fiber assembly protein [Citrobacter braakii]MBC2635687.1 tail fiber assembly protein [Citrobacter braakii]MBC2648406.1 tail fiber assembly protein [Citrobacter braakii]
MKEYITLNAQGFAEKSGWIVCYLTKPDGEYIGFIDEFIPATAGLPAGAYIDEPPADEAGKAIIRVGDKWELVDDHRGETVYSTESGQPIEVKAPGDYPENTTPLAPVTPFDKWNGSAWVTDETKLKAANIAENEFRKAQLRAQADSEIAWRLDAVNDGYATEQEAADLVKWKKYRVLLMRVDTSKVPDIAWPPVPN